MALSEWTRMLILLSLQENAGLYVVDYQMYILEGWIELSGFDTPR